MWPNCRIETHGPCPRSVNTGVHNDARVQRAVSTDGSRAVLVTPVTNTAIFDTRFHGPYPRPVNTGVILDTRVHGPCSRAVDTARGHR